jgi:transposase
MNNTTYAVDLAKRVFQVHWVELPSGEIKRKPLARAELRAFFAGSPHFQCNNIR